jgi:hypothetical protein
MPAFLTRTKNFARVARRRTKAGISRLIDPN